MHRRLRSEGLFGAQAQEAGRPKPARLRPFSTSTRTILMHGALGPDDQLYQCFPLGGEVRTLVVGGDWQDVTGANERKAIMLRVPAGSKRVLLRSSVEDIAGTPATEAQEATSWTIDNLIQPFSVDRDRDGPRFYVAIDPTDDGAGTDPVRLKVIFGG